MAWRRAISSPGLEYSLRGGVSFSNAPNLHYVFSQKEEKAARKILLGAFDIADGSRGGDFHDSAISQAQCALRLSSGDVASPFGVASSNPLLQRVPSDPAFAATPVPAHAQEHPFDLAMTDKVRYAAGPRSRHPLGLVCRHPLGVPARCS